MVAHWHSRASAKAVVLGLALAATALVAEAEEVPRRMPWPSADQPAYPTSPFHGMVNGDGKIIPCRCRFQGHEFRVGEEVCMPTHLGVVMTRCDLLQNNTSWVPTGTACTISKAPETAGYSTLAARAER